MESRWQVLKETSASGKTMFRCLICKRVSPTPDKNCPTMDCGPIEYRLRHSARNLRFDDLEDLKEKADKPLKVGYRPVNAPVDPGKPPGHRSPEDKERDALKLLQEAFQEGGKVGVVWSRNKELEPWETLVTDGFYDALIQFTEGTGSKILLMERHEDDDEVNDCQLEALQEFFPELRITVKEPVQEEQEPWAWKCPGCGEFKDLYQDCDAIILRDRWNIACHTCQLFGSGKTRPEAVKSFMNDFKEDPPDKRGKRNPGFGPLTEAFKEDFRKGWKCGCEDLAKGEDNTEMAFTKEPPWFACGYASALNRWNGTVNRYTQLGSELGCEEPKGPKK